MPEKRYLGISVLDAARQRISEAFADLEFSEAWEIE